MFVLLFVKVGAKNVNAHKMNSHFICIYNIFLDVQFTPLPEKLHYKINDFI